MYNEQLYNLRQTSENNQIKNQIKPISKNKTIKKQKWRPGQNLQKKKTINKDQKNFKQE